MLSVTTEPTGSGFGMNADSTPSAPAEVDDQTPSVARIYDWYLGGHNNYAVDREWAKKGLQLFPPVQGLALQNRRWLGRVIREAIHNGIRQFLDIGSGIPTAGNVHEVARNTLSAGDTARVVYVDNEPIAVAHSKMILDSEDVTGWTAIVDADLREPELIYAHRETNRLLDLDRPVCLLMAAAVHFVGGDDDIADIISRFRAPLAPGSWMAISHFTKSPDATTEQQDQVQRLADAYANTTNPIWLRNPDEITSWFAGFPLLEPGLVYLPDWRPDDPDVDPRDLEFVRPYGLCAVGEKV